MRVCCDKSPSFKVIYDGGSVGNDTIFVCSAHITEHPFNKMIISTEVIETASRGK